MTLQDCTKQRPSPFPLVSSPFVGHPIPYNGNLSSKLADWLQLLASIVHFCIGLNAPMFRKMSHFQTRETLLRFLPHLLQLRAWDQIMRGHWQWPDCCWLQGQWNLPDPTSPPVHTEPFGTFTFHRENIDHGAVVNLEADIYKDSGMYTCTIKLPS